MPQYAGYDDPTGKPVPPSPSGRTLKPYGITQADYDARLAAGTTDDTVLYVIEPEVVA